MSPTNTPRKQGRAENFGHSAVIELCKQFYYNGKADCLSVLFPGYFKTCPKACLAMACTAVGISLVCFFFRSSHRQILNCLNEHEGGYEVKIPFTGDRYESVHAAMLSLINQLQTHNYHGEKLVALLEKIATEGRSVTFLPPSYCTDFVTRLRNLKRRGDPKAHGFKLILD